MIALHHSLSVRVTHVIFVLSRQKANCPPRAVAAFLPLLARPHRSKRIYTRMYLFGLTDAKISDSLHRIDCSLSVEVTAEGLRAHNFILVIVPLLVRSSSTGERS